MAFILMCRGYYCEDMGIEEKYKIHYVDGRRFYEFDMTEKLPCLEETSPYLFRCKDIQVCCGTWNRMTLGILSELDRRNPKSDEELLSIKYEFSKCEVFSRTKKTNYSPFRDLYLDTNHTSSHSMMNIQCLLRAYGVDLSECFFLYHAHPVSEPDDAKEYFASQAKTAFRKALLLRGFSESSVDNIIKSFDIINRLLKIASKSNPDFFLIDSLYYFFGLKERTLAVAKDRLSNPKKAEIVKKYLLYYEDFLRNHSFYEELEGKKIGKEIIDAIGSTLKNALDNSPVGAVSAEKIYADFAIYHSELMAGLGDLGNQRGIYLLANCYFGKTYYFKDPYIAKTPGMKLSGDDLIIEYVYKKDEVYLPEITNFCKKIHIKGISSIKWLLNAIAPDYVQVDADRVVSKSLLSLPEDVIDAIKRELMVSMGESGETAVDKYHGYIFLPQLDYGWNKYLLMGITRSYLGEFFSVEQRTSEIDGPMFFIKKVA